MLEFIQPSLDFTFYLIFGTYFQGETQVQKYYSIFALFACTFYAIIVAPYKLNMFPNLRLIARYGMAAIGITSFILSVLLTLENNRLFIYAYWSTFMLSLYIGTFLVKANKSRTD